MRTALGLTAVTLSLGALAVPADAGCVDDYLVGDEYVMFDVSTVRRNPDGSYTVYPSGPATDARTASGFAISVAFNEVGRVSELVDCVK